MKETNFELNETWLNGKYTIDGNKVEINTSLPYISIEGFFSDGGDFFAQGHEADNYISEIHKIWLKNDVTQAEAVKMFINMYSS